MGERDTTYGGPSGPSSHENGRHQAPGAEAEADDRPVVSASGAPGERSGSVVTANGLTICPEGARTITHLSQADHGTVVVNHDGTITYRPADGYSGPDTFTYEFEGVDGVRMHARVQLDVAADVEPEPPAASEEPQLQVIRLTDGAHGKVRMDDRGAVIYRPREGFVGTDRFTYTLRTADGAEEVHTVVVTVDEEGRATLAVERGSHASEGLGVTEAAE